MNFIVQPNNQVGAEKSMKGSSLFRVGNGMTGVISLPGGFRPHES
jgi:hypothetical protein